MNGPETHDDAVMWHLPPWEGPAAVFPAPTPGPALLDRYTGCLVGGAIGDALGRPVETRPPDRVRLTYPSGLTDFQPWHGWTEGPKGTFTDDAWIREGNYAVIEVHPEVCFANMANGHLHTRKKTWAGVEKRRQLLDVAGIQMPNDLGLAGEMAAVDDVLDAAAAAWTARRYADDRATSMPENPEMFSDRIKCAIWA